MCFLSWVIPVKLAPLSDNPTEDGEPAFDLVEPGGVRRREVEMNVFVASQPAPALGLVGVEVVEDDVDLALGMGGHDPVHEVEKLDPPPALVVARHHLAADDIEGGEQGRGAVALVVVRPAAEGAAVRQLEITLGAFERLDVRLLVDSNDQRTLRRVEIEPDNLGRLGGKLGILADAPTLAPGQIDLLRPQETPDILFVHLAQRGGDQGRGPARVTGRRRAVEHAENTLAGVGRVAWCRTPLAGFVETGPALLGVAHPPLARRPDGADRPLPSAASNTIRARCLSRYSVLVERAKPSNSARSAAVKTIAVASGMLLMHH